MDVYAQLARNKSKQQQRPTNLTLGSSQSQPSLASHPSVSSHHPPFPHQQQLLHQHPLPQPIVRHSTGLSPPPIPSILGSPPPPSPPLPPQQPSLPTRFLRSLSSSILPSSSSSPASSSAVPTHDPAHDSGDARSSHSTGSTCPSPFPTSSSSASLTSSSTTLPGPPRTHWRPDAQATECVECGTAFNLIQRRHHCRKCGDIFCAKCSAFQARLDDALQFSGHAGHLVRVCKVCYRAADRDRSDPRVLRREVERLRTHKLMLERERSLRLEQSMQQQAAAGGGAAAGRASGGELAVGGPALATLAAPGVAPALSTATSQPMAAPARPQQPGEGDKDKDGIGMLGSVPSDWNWSTF